MKELKNDETMGGKKELVLFSESMKICKQNYTAEGYSSRTECKCYENSNKVKTI